MTFRAELTPTVGLVKDYLILSNLRGDGDLEILLFGDFLGDRLLLRLLLRLLCDTTAKKKKREVNTLT